MRNHPAVPPPQSSGGAGDGRAFMAAACAAKELRKVRDEEVRPLLERLREAIRRVAGHCVSCQLWGGKYDVLVAKLHHETQITVFM